MELSYDIYSVSEEKDVIHISQIDEYLASRIIGEGTNKLSLKVGKSGNDGHLSILIITNQNSAGRDPLDFELSTSEYHSLNETRLEELLLAPLVTSSALELFDFLLLRLKGFNCLISFTGNAWEIEVTEILDN